MPNISRIILAVERTELEPAAQGFCLHHFPHAQVSALTVPTFIDSLDRERNPEELRVLMLQATEDGELDAGSSLARSVLNSPVPVLVLRSRGTGFDFPKEVDRVVVPLDGSMSAAQALPLASRVATELGLPVRFLMVIDPSRVIPPAYAYDPDAWDMVEELRQTSHWALSQAEAALRLEGIEVGSDLLFGPVNASLSANIGPTDLVIMATHGDSRPFARQRDSVTLRTLVSVPQPMIVMRAAQQEPVVVDGYQACSWAEPLHHAGVQRA